MSLEVEKPLQSQKMGKSSDERVVGRSEAAKVEGAR